jgi:hypothetical protein
MGRRFWTYAMRLTLHILMTYPENQDLGKDELVTIFNHLYEIEIKTQEHYKESGMGISKLDKQYAEHTYDNRPQWVQICNKDNPSEAEKARRAAEWAAAEARVKGVLQDIRNGVMSIKPVEDKPTRTYKKRKYVIQNPSSEIDADTAQPRKKTKAKSVATSGTDLANNTGNYVPAFTDGVAGDNTTSSRKKTEPASNTAVGGNSTRQLRKSRSANQASGARVRYDTPVSASVLHGNSAAYSSSSATPFGGIEHFVQASNEGAGAAVASENEMGSGSFNGDGPAGIGQFGSSPSSSSPLISLPSTPSTQAIDIQYDPSVFQVLHTQYHPDEVSCFKLSEGVPGPRAILYRLHTDRGFLFTIRVGDTVIERLRLEEVCDYIDPQQLEVFEHEMSRAVEPEGQRVTLATLPAEKETGEDGQPIPTEEKLQWWSFMGMRQDAFGFKGI